QAKATLEQAAHMGDDLNDLKLLEACGLGLAPMDAVAEVREAAHWLVPVPGGRGAARAVSDRIIKARRAAGLTAGEMGRHLEA
ncbi:MAG: HAD hydrolase family protein, partial [Rhodospirillales bacterium]